MKKRVFIGVFLIISLIGLIYMIVINSIFKKNNEIVNQYIPEIEISDSELRKTIVNLYFVDSNGKLNREERIIDSKELLRNPYISLIRMLLEGPDSSDLKSVIPNGTKIIDARLNKKCVIVNLSKEFIEESDIDINQRKNRIYMIVNTLTELNEVQSVKFLIEGEEIEGFNDGGLKLTNEFARIDIQ